MRILFNSYNTIGCGTANVTKFVLKLLSQKRLSYEIFFLIPRIHLFSEYRSRLRLKIWRVPFFDNIPRLFFRSVYDLFILPLISMILNTSTVIVLANYSPMPVRGKKIVFMRDPFLIIDGSYAQKRKADRITGMIREVVFRITLLSTDIVIVQSYYIKRMLLVRYKNIKAQVRVLPNPVSNLINHNIVVYDDSQISHKRSVLYVSRYYPHKQHEFIVRMVEKYKDELRRHKIKFYITIEPKISGFGAQQILEDIKCKNIFDIIYNLGEIPNEQMGRYYRLASCLFFPSAAETFGNPLVEAMAFGLPIIVPDMGYAKAVCGEAGLYFTAGNEDDAYGKILALLTNSAFHEEFSAKSREQYKIFPTTDQWFELLMAMAS